MYIVQNTVQLVALGNPLLSNNKIIGIWYVPVSTPKYFTSCGFSLKVGERPKRNFCSVQN